MLRILIWIPFLISLGLTLFYLWIDYKHFQKPLVEFKPDVTYTFSHHLKVVVIPKVKYVLRERVMSRNSSNS